MPLRPGSSPALRISIDHNDSHIYTTMERIRGTVTVVALTDTPFEAIDIEVLGSAKTSGRRVVAQSPFARTANTSHRFLKLKQPDVHLHCPDDGVLRAGCSYRIPFEFAIPESTLPTSCCHAPSSPALFEAHTQTPPSFGDRSIGEATDFAPRGISVKYRVVVRVHARAESTHDPPSGTISEVSRRIRFRPYPSTNALFTPNSDRQYQRPQGITLRKGWLRPCGIVLLGSAKASVLNAGTIEENQDRSHVGNVTGEMTICLCFHPSGNDVAPPDEGDLRGYLRPSTTASVCSLPQPPSSALWSNPEADIHKAPAINLIDQSIGKVQWTRNPRDNSRAPEGCTGCATAARSAPCPGDTPTELQGVQCYRAEVKVPINSAVPFLLTPSFSSCLVSRSYSLDLRLSVPKPSLGSGSTMRFELPVQVVSCPEYQQSRRAEHTSSPWQQTPSQPYAPFEGHFPVDTLDLEELPDAPPSYDSLGHGIRR